MHSKKPLPSPKNVFRAPEIQSILLRQPLFPVRNLYRLQRILLVRLGLHAVVCLGDDRGREGVGLADVGAGLEVLPVDVVDDVGLGQGQEVVVALLGLRVVLELAVTPFPGRKGGK